MKKIITISPIIIILVGLGWFLFLNNPINDSSNIEVSRLAQMGDECLGISDKAVVDLTAVVEFQKLEILSRKANVMKNCMQDRGFHENPAWRKYEEPLAKAQASKQNISFDEAIENVRKVDMWVLNKKDQRPLYWSAIKD